MGLKRNIDYWEISLAHPEPVGEDFYKHDEVIVEDEAFLSAAARLRERITAYCALSEMEVDASVLNQVVIAIDEILRNTKHIQYTEFVAYWKCLDMTFSVYEAIRDDTRRLEILTEALKHYCIRRRRLYDRLGYSHVVQQALYDNAKARSQGASGVRKLRDILQQTAGQNIREARNVEEFQRKRLCWLIPTADQRRSFVQLMRRLKARYSFGETHQGKIPDMVIKLGKIVFVIEAKHIKEPGGAQDKQIKELIDYVAQQEPEESPVHHVAFLDGLYFNIIASAQTGTKPYQQRVDIENALRENPRNYFVNTAGLRHLLQDAYQLAKRGSTPKSPRPNTRPASNSGTLTPDKGGTPTCEA